MVADFVLLECIGNFKIWFFRKSLIFLVFPFPVSKAKILGNPELFIKSGSDINLTCVALQAPAPPAHIYWDKDGRLINYSTRGGINILTERQTKTSRLLISRAVPADSGNYTCSPSNSGMSLPFLQFLLFSYFSWFTDPISVVVHVIKSEHRAAMQHENSSGNKFKISLSLIYFIIGLSRGFRW